jgi:hypothetical protein
MGSMAGAAVSRRGARYALALGPLIVSMFALASGRDAAT